MIPSSIPDTAPAPPTIAAAGPTDLPDYLDLLERAGLPGEGLAESLGSALVARDGGGTLRGAVALELYGPAVLLRSLVVDAGRRQSGLGSALLDGALALARHRGATAVYLLTETAAPFFLRRGFIPLERAAVPAAVQASVELRSVCPASATAMTLSLLSDPPFPLPENDRSLMPSTTMQDPTTPQPAAACCGPDCCSGTTTKPVIDHEALVAEVKARYAEIAAGGGGCCGPTACGCGASATSDASRAVARGIGYTEEEIALLPEGANLGLGCGAPLAALAPQPGETVLDLGSGAGMDAFLAAERVGPSGRVIGVDMTPEMLERARATATRLGLAQVEFRAGRLEALPVDDASVDAVTSNCVINLVPDKGRVFAEIARVLRPGGRLVISDIVLERALPERLAGDLLAYSGCVAGAALRTDYLAALAAAGLGEVEILRDVDYLASVYAAIPEEIDGLLARAGTTAAELGGSVRSITFRARAVAG